MQRHGLLPVPLQAMDRPGRSAYLSERFLRYTARPASAVPERTTRVTHTRGWLSSPVWGMAVIVVAGAAGAETLFTTLVFVVLLLLVLLLLLLLLPSGGVGGSAGATGRLRIYGFLCTASP